MKKTLFFFGITDKSTRLSQPETYNKNGELHTFSQTYLANEWHQLDKQNKDESLFKLFISKLINLRFKTSFIEIINSSICKHGIWQN